MKTIGLLGGMSWESTVPYYTTLNRLASERLGGLHSAKILLSSVDFAPPASRAGGCRRRARLRNQDLAAPFSHRAVEPDERRHPFTQTTWWSVWITSTRSLCASITASIGL